MKNQNEYFFNEPFVFHEVLNDQNVDDQNFSMRQDVHDFLIVERDVKME